MPTIVNVTPAVVRSDEPTAAGDAPKCRRQVAVLITMAGAAPSAKSCGPINRPCRGVNPSAPK